MSVDRTLEENQGLVWLVLVTRQVVESVDAATFCKTPADVFIPAAILCNAGGVTVSYLEWVQNRAGLRWELRRVDAELKKTIVNAARRVRLAAHQYGVDLKTAAYAVAIEHLVKAYVQRGIFS
jgi:glutamate dehydrogenase (NAD(P)+)